MIIIDLGSFTAMTKVAVNNMYAGRLGTAPYEQKLPLAQRLTWCPINPVTADSILQPLGLFGPVKIFKNTT